MIYDCLASVRRLIVSVLIVLAAALPTLAAPPYSFYSRGPYRAGTPRPSAVLGYEAGESHTTFRDQERVLLAIAAAARDRVKVVEYGKSIEGRPLRLFLVSSPANLARLETIRTQIAQLADPRTLTAASEAERIVKTTPCLVWINHCIHGNETASFESAMWDLYTLAASRSPEIERALSEAVVVLNPVFNPDGHERFVVYYNSVAVGSPDGFSFEHREPWAIEGRFNHYRFDMNRDKLAQSQPEVRQETAAFLHWHPQVFADEHGQPETYFFPPNAQATNSNVDRTRLEKWTDLFGRANAAAFDRHGWRYVTRETFDFFYPGYLDSWTTLSGAIGMTYETDGGGNLARRRQDGTVSTLRDAMAHHFEATLATIEAAANHREELLRDFLAYRRSAVAAGQRGPMRRIVILPGADPNRAAELASLLLRTGVEVHETSAPFHSAAAHAYLLREESKEKEGKEKKEDGKAKGLPAILRGAGARGPSPLAGEEPEARGGGFPLLELEERAGQAATATDKRRSAKVDFPAGALIVDLAQPQGLLARAFLEPNADFEPEFVKEQLARRERNEKRNENEPMEEYGFYDTTAWSLPYTYGLEAYWIEDAPVVVEKPLAADANGVVTLTTQHGGVQGDKAPIAYLFRYDRDTAAFLALKLEQEGFRLAVATRPVRAGGREWPRGTLIAFVSRNPETLPARISVLAKRLNVEVRAIQSHYGDASPVTLGSDAVQPLKRPRIAVIVDDNVDQTSFGAVWFLLERQVGIPFTPIRSHSLSSDVLDRFNVVVFPAGGDYTDALDGNLESLKSWVGRGDVLIALSGAWLTDKKVGLSTAAPVGPEEKAAGAKADEKEDRRSRPIDLPGAIFRARIDPTHFLGYGYPGGELPVPLSGDAFLKPSKQGANVITFDAKPACLAGFTWPDNTERLLAGTSWLIDEPVGSGHAILFLNDPTYRALWPGLRRCLLSALLFAPSRSALRPDGE